MAEPGVLQCFARFLFDMVLPPRCLGCGEPVDRQGGLCGPCWMGLTFLGPPYCDQCGTPFPHPMGEEDDSNGGQEKILCGQCVATPPNFTRGRSVVAYDNGSKPLILSFKHGDRTDCAPIYGAWMARAGADLLETADILTPVPLHWGRLFHRRYNQAALLAQEIERQSGKPAVLDALIRRRSTLSQGGRGRTARFRNVRGAFETRARRAALIQGARVLVIDDVMTTGATISECARMLLHAGARQVDALTLARVVL
ncbi:competence protein ComFC [Azospirillaceae bacterium]